MFAMNSLSRRLVLPLTKAPALSLAALAFSDLALRLAWRGFMTPLTSHLNAADLVVNSWFRDALLLAVVYLLTVRFKSTLKGLCSLRCMLPFVILLLAAFVNKVIAIKMYRLPWDLLTTLVITTGLCKDILIVSAVYLLTSAAHATLRKALFLILYLTLVLVAVLDTVYLHFTSSHIQSVLFDNMGYCGLRGAVSNLSAMHYVLIGSGTVTLLWLSIWSINDDFTWRKVRCLLAVLPAICVTLAIAYAVKFGIIALNHRVIHPDSMQYAEVVKSKELDAPHRMQHYRDLVSVSPTVNLIREIAVYAQETRKQEIARTFMPFLPEERRYLEGLGLVGIKEADPQLAANPPYRTIVFILFESLHRDFLHYYNPVIPQAASKTFDELLEHYPHVDNYYTSASPTTLGLSAQFLSHVYWWGSKDIYQPESLYTMLSQKRGMAGYFVSGTSGYFADEFLWYPKIFNMKHYINKEELDKRYPHSSGWGHHDDVIFDEGMRILTEYRDEPKLVVLKTIDLHDPGMYSGIAETQLPPEIGYQSSSTLRAMHWDDFCLWWFFKRVKDAGLFTPDTLFVISADHAPNIRAELTRLVPAEGCDNLARIPLIFVSANVAPFTGLDEKKYGSQIDIAPTMLQVMGVPKPTNFIGQSLLSKREGVALGYYENVFRCRRKGEDISINLSEPDQTDCRKTALYKWFNNLYSEQFIRFGPNYLYH